jgi:hypothetical protein
MESLLNSLNTNHITTETVLVLLLISFCAGSIGGALSALKLGGAIVGNDLALFMGGFFGPIAAVPGILIGLVILKLI